MIPTFRYGTRGSGSSGRWSLCALLFVMLTGAAFMWQRSPSNNIQWDAYAYYLYLPSVFLHDDPGLLDQRWLDEAQARYNVTGGGVLYQANELENGARVIKVSMGLSVLWLPFFGIGHAWAGLCGAPQDGFSAPYQWSLVLAGAVYLVFGLFLLRRVLLRYFPDGVVALSLLLLAFGTNWAHHATFGLLMPHVLLFNFVTLLIWNTIRWHEDHRIRHMAGIALALGILVLSRPTDIVAVLLPLLWGLDPRDRNAWRARWSLLRAHGHQIVTAGVLLLAMAAPQLIYWKVVTGSWIFMSYTGAAEGFDLLRPHLWDVLFSFRKGWFIYTPIMAIALAGLIRPAASIRPVSAALLVYVVVNTWVVASWSNWWYASSFGHRAVVESYPALVLGLGAVLMRLREAPVGWRLSGGFLLSALTAFHLFQFWQFDQGVLRADHMTWPYYRAVFGRLAAPAGAEELLSIDHTRNDPGDFHAARYRRSAVHVLTSVTGFNGTTNDTLLLHGMPAKRLDEPDSFSPAFHRPYEEVTSRDHIWVRASAELFLPEGSSGELGALVATMEHNGENYAYEALDLHAAQLIPGQWNRVEMMYLTPEVRRGADPLIVYYWHRSTTPVFVGELVIETYERKLP